MTLQTALGLAPIFGLKPRPTPLPDQPLPEPRLTTIRIGSSVLAQGDALRQHPCGRVTIADCDLRLTGWPVKTAPRKSSL